MRCYFIRHGQSTNNLLYEKTGSTAERSEDPELTLLGLEQAKRAGNYLLRGSDPGDPFRNKKGFGITHVYTSLMVRAIYTGNEISKTLALPLVGWKDLHEQGGIFCQKTENGERIGLPGNNKQNLQVKFPDLCIPEEIGGIGWWNRSHESTEEARERGKRVLGHILERHGGTDDRILLVSHGAFYACFMGAVLNLIEPDHYWFVLNNTGITRVDFMDQYICLVYQNHVGFLKAKQIS